jgi:hypothetical protein
VLPANLMGLNSSSNSPFNNFEDSRRQLNNGLEKDDSNFADNKKINKVKIKLIFKKS